MRNIIKTRRYSQALRHEKSVSTYDQSGKRVARYQSFADAAASLKISRQTIRVHIKSGLPLECGLIIRYSITEECNRNIEKPFTITPEDDVPVAIFDKQTHQYIASYKSISQFASSMQRPLKTVVGWLDGDRCTDPDFYYRRERECTPEQINNKFLK